MTLRELVEAVEARTRYRYSRWGNPASSIANQLGRAEGPGPGQRIDYTPGDLEAVVAWLRMNDAFGEVRRQHFIWLRREIQRRVSEGHRPGWWVISAGGAWFTSEPPLSVLMSAAGAGVLPVHQDCACLESEAA